MDVTAGTSSWMSLGLKKKKKKTSPIQAALGVQLPAPLCLLGVLTVNTQRLSPHWNVAPVSAIPLGQGQSLWGLQAAFGRADPPPGGLATLVWGGTATTPATATAHGTPLLAEAGRYPPFLSAPPDPPAPPPSVSLQGSLFLPVVDFIFTRGRKGVI